MPIFKVRLNREIYVEATDESEAQQKALLGEYGDEGDHRDGFEMLWDDGDVKKLKTKAASAA